MPVWEAHSERDRICSRPRLSDWPCTELRTGEPPSAEESSDSAHAQHYVSEFSVLLGEVGPIKRDVEEEAQCGDRSIDLWGVGSARRNMQLITTQIFLAGAIW